MEKKVRIIVSGNVQGVGFRYYIKRTASDLGLKGYVKNLPNMKVEIVAEGKEEELKQLVEVAKKGPGYSEVKGIDVFFDEAEKEFSGFLIK